MSGSRQSEDVRAKYGTDPDEIFIELSAGRPSYIRLQAGHYLQEGDSFHREQLGVGSPTLDTWEVVDITRETVTGRDTDTDEEVTWDRGNVEKGLAIGTYSTNLTDFEQISVYQVGRWEDYEEGGDDSGLRYTGRPYVAVVAYGDNGLKYGLRYRFVDEDSNTLALWKRDEPVGGFSEDAAARLDEQVRAALEADGYAIRKDDD